MTDEVTINDAYAWDKEEKKKHKARENNRIFCPLLDSLVVICKHYKIITTPNKLSAGLPLEKGLMTPALFLQAAERAGLSARLLPTKLEELSPLLLPVVLLLLDGKACVVTKLDVDSKQAKVVFPESGGGSEDVSFNTLEAQYTGQAFYIKKKHLYDARSEETLNLKSRHWFWSTIFRSLPIYRDVLIASFVINLFVVISPLFVMNVYDRVIPNNAVETLWTLAIGASIAYLLDFALKMARCHFIDLAGKKSDILLSAKLFEQSMGIEMASRPVSVGSFAKHIQEFDYIREFITSSTIAALVDLPFSFLILAVIAWLAGPLAWVVVAAMVILAIYSLIIQPGLKEAIENTQQAGAQKHATLIETLTGIEAVKAQSAEGELQSKWEKLCGHIAQWEIRSRILTSSASNLSSFLIQFITIAVVLCGYYQISSQQLSMGGLIATVLLSGRCLSPFAQLTSIATRYYQSKSALTALEGVMKLPQEHLCHDASITTPECNSSITVTNLSFSYPNQVKPALQDITISIQAGEKIAIIGRVGSGKSTLIKLMMRFYKPNTGYIRVDGIDIQQVSPHELRSKTGYLPQESQLFFGSVRDNIAFGCTHIEDSNILEVARLAGVTEFTDLHPMGLQMPVAERGSNLSGGQQQAIALARALLSNPNILLLDEPCSSMDMLTEQLIRSKLEAIGEHKTLIMTTHRYSMLEIVDRIIILEDGKIVADGPKEQVFQNSADNQEDSSV